MMNYNYKYLITSERAYRREDEANNEFYSNKKFNVGDTIILDGLVWTIVEIL